MNERLYYAFFPKKCLACGKVIDRQHIYCESCQSKMPYITGERCERCGADKAQCSCKNAKAHYDALIAPFYYEGGAKIALLKLKKYPIYAKGVALECQKVIDTFFGSDAFDCISCVPMHPKKQREYGFNHSEVLAREIAALSGIRFVPLLQVLYETHAQHRLEFADRTGNVRGIYDLAPSAQVQGKRILLADDIKTSGATLNECALMLKLGGALEVKAVVAAIKTTKQKGE